MNPLEAKKQRIRYNKWRDRAITRLIPLLSFYFSQPQTTEMTRKVGRVIERLHNPYFDILDGKGEHLTAENVIALRILLQIEVEEVVRFIKSAQLYNKVKNK